MVRDFNSGKSTQKRNTASGKRTTSQSVRKVKPVQPVKKASTSANRGGKKPIKKKKNGILANLLYSNRTPGEMDYTFLLLVGVLVAFGLIMLLSASTPTANVKFGRSYHFFLRQFLFVMLGTGAMFALAHIDYRNLKPYARVFMVICIGLLVLVFLPGIGVSHNGSRRWINLGFMELQPSEIMKVSIAMFFAALIEDKKYDIRTNKGLGQYIVWIGIVAVLLLAETHLSGTIVICGIALCVLLVGGANAGLIIGGGGLAGVALVGVVAAVNPARMARLTSFLNPFTDMQGTGYQTAQAVYAIGSGGIFGKGLGESVQKFSYLPEPYNDFIFAVICEELGLIGAIMIIGLFIGLIIRGIKIAMEAEDVFGSLTVVGIMAQVAIQTILNIGVATASIPNTGVSLPFFSYGGTAIMILLAEMGIVLSVSRFSSKNK
ncbi:MAG: putative lipid II flippase FtsW [Clostridia bacterium]|nr:putative lipid II flippase FtsW [Clostridia bacterium]